MRILKTISFFLVHLFLLTLLSPVSLAAPSEPLLEELSKLSPTEIKQIQKNTPKSEIVERYNALSPEQQQKALKKAGQLESKPAAKPAANKKPPATKKTVGLNAIDIYKGSIRKPYPASLPQFGYNLFTNIETGFTPKIDISIPPDYILGPYDTFDVQLSGREYTKFTLSVDREGMITVPDIGPIPVGGMPFNEFKTMLHQQVKTKMFGMEVAHVSMGALRSIRILILGDVRKPGSFSVSALSTLTNALLESGGINPIGSLRKIQLKRKGQVVTTIDLYKLLLYGDSSQDIRIQEGDVIFVPPIGYTIGLVGGVKRPAIYELLHEKTLEDVLNMAGGLLVTADPTLIKLERITDKKKRVLLDLDITKPKNLRTRIQSGDTIQILSMSERMVNTVTLAGYVERPGRYQWYQGMSLVDLLPKKSSLKLQTDLAYALISRDRSTDIRMTTLSVRLDRALDDPSSPDNLKLRPEDTITLFALGQNRAENVEDVVKTLQQQVRYDHTEQIVSVGGNIRFPGSYPYSVGMSLKTLIHAAGDIFPNTDMDYALIVRKDSSGQIKPFSIQLGPIMNGLSDVADLRLQPLDFLLVFKSKEIGEEPSRQALLKPVLDTLREQAVHTQNLKIVQVLGQVRFPGEYPLEEEMRISDMIRAAGRLSEPAYTLAATLSRHSLNKEQTRLVNHENITIQKILQGDPTMDLRVQSHDTLTIKQIPRWQQDRHFSLEGMVKFPGIYSIQVGESLLQLIERAGGLTSQAHPKGAVFLRKSLQKRENMERELLADRLEQQLVVKKIETSNVTESGMQSDDVQMLLGLIARMRTLPSQGRLTINLHEMIQNKLDTTNTKNQSQITLRDGDRLIIPQRINEVTVIGEVFRPSSHQFDSSFNLDDYIKMSGNYNELGDSKRVYVVKADGKVVSRTSAKRVLGISWFSENTISDIEPGDTIVIPMKVDRIDTLAMWKDVTQVLSNIAISVATMHTVGML